MWLPPSGGREDCSVSRSQCGFRLQAEEKRPAALQSRYANANPSCARNIIRYMCAHDVWFSSVARSSGRRSMRTQTYSAVHRQHRREQQQQDPVTSQNAGPRSERYEHEWQDERRRNHPRGPADTEANRQRPASAPRVPSMSAKSLVVDRAQQEQPEHRADEPGLDAGHRLHRDQPATLSRTPRGIAIVTFAIRPRCFVLNGGTEYAMVKPAAARTSQKHSCRPSGATSQARTSAAP